MNASHSGHNNSPPQTPEDATRIYALIRAAVAQVRGCGPRTPLHERVAAHAACARLLARERATGSAEAYFEQALAYALWLPAMDSAVELSCELAEALADQAQHECNLPREQRNAARRRALAHADQAAQLAPRLACAVAEARMLCRISELLSRCGRAEEALAMRERALQLGGALPTG